jgi:curved DNA-binding protein CbpA
MTDFYEILEVQKTATDDEIKKSYRRLALKWHPDKNLSNKIQAEEKFKLISEAYEVLSDKDKRRKYDQLGRAGLSNGHGNSGYSSNGGYSRFSEDFLNRTFHFHNPFDIFEQFMSHFGMDDDFGFGMNPFADLHNRHHRFGNLNSSSSRRDPHRQQMALFDSMFSPMRMSLFNHDPFGHDFGGHSMGTISSFNVSFGNGNSRPVAKKTTKSAKIINGRRVVTTRVEENGQTTETVEEDGRITSRKINGITQAIK